MVTVVVFDIPIVTGTPGSTIARILATHSSSFSRMSSVVAVIVKQSVIGILPVMNVRNDPPTVKSEESERKEMLHEFGAKVRHS